MLIKPKPKKLFVPKPKPIKRLKAFNDDAPEGSFQETYGLDPNYVDERIQAVLNAMSQEADRIEDKFIREQWKDALQTFARTGDLRVLLDQTKWKRRPVDMEQFLFDSFYLGQDKGFLYPKILEALLELDEGDFNEVILMGAIGIGKTTLANVGIIRDAYMLSCMRNPQTASGLQAKTFITFTVQSIRLSTAEKAIFTEMGALIDDSPYFSQIFPYDRRIKSVMIFPSHRIRILPVTSSTTGIISMNVIGGFMDEANFMAKISKSKSQFAGEDGEFDQARQLYQTLASRRKSRFNKKGKMPGKLYLASSSRYPTDFTLERAKKAEMFGGTDPKIYVYNYSQWEGKPRSLFMDEEFRVQVGNEQFRSRILEPNEAAGLGCHVLDVPMDFKQEFIDDIDKAIRDLAGKTVLSTNPFIGRRESIQEAFDLASKYRFENPYPVQEAILDPNNILLPDKSKLRLDVPSFRIAHVDLGWRGDAAGIAVGHVTGYKVQSYGGEEGEERMSILPIIAIDCIMRAVRAPGDEIDFSGVRAFLIKLRDSGLPIKYVTTDGFQSVDTRQILKKQGFITDYQSVESIESSRTLRDSMYDKRLFMPQHAHLHKELRELESVTHNNKDKADHPASGSKDLVDGVAGVVQFLMTRRSTWSTGTFIGKGAGYHFLGKTDRLANTNENSPIIVSEDGAGSRKRVRTSARKTTERRAIERK